MWKVSKQFSFEAAHSLPHLPEGHKCRNLHGHSYGVTVVCEGWLDPEKAWVVDYADISAAMQPIIQALDHKNVNDVILITSTSENLAFWIFSQLRGKLTGLKEIQVQETRKTNVVYSE